MPIDMTEIEELAPLLRAIATVHAAEGANDRLSDELRQYHQDAAKRCRQAAALLPSLLAEIKRGREALEKIRDDKTASCDVWEIARAALEELDNCRRKR